MEVSQPAYVAPYYQADIKAQVGGVVRRVTKAIGSPVKKDETLIEVSVPDLDADVAKKQAVVTQREREREVAHAMLDRARALEKVAASEIDVQLAAVDEADATTNFRYREYKRFTTMARGDTITENVVDERRKFYEAARANSRKARAGVERAKADVLEAKAKVREALADEQLKEQLIDVAKKDLAQAKALFSYATVLSPFDGVVTYRKVDPGSFVQNSTSSPGVVLMTVERTDLLTIYSNIPDNYAPEIDDRTEVIVRLSELPGVRIKAHVMRTSRSLQTPSSDRTMRVEVDLYNRAPSTYEAFAQAEKASKLANLKDKQLPVLPQVKGKIDLDRKLMPGMYGTMKLVLRNYKQASLLPSGAVFTRGGVSYIFLVRDNVAHLVEVERQMDDGKRAKVVVKEKGQRRELRPDELVVRSRQTELTNGQRVSPSVVKWGERQ
jgi:multidrug resistance efflux pump